MNGNNYKFLSRKIILIIVSVSLTPLFLTCIIILTHFNTAYKNKAHEHMAELVQKHRQGIDNFLTASLANIRVLARSYKVDQLYDSQFLSRKLRLLNEEYNGVYVDLGLVDSEGIQVAYAGPFNLLGADYARAEWFTRTLSSEHFISDVFTGLRGSPHFIVAVKQKWNGRDWILRATINFKTFNSLVENIRIGNTGFQFILNRQGSFQTKPRAEVCMKDSVFQEFFNQNAGGTNIELRECTDGGSKTYIVGAAALNQGNWFLCVQQEYEDAFAVVRQTQLVAFIAVGIGGLLIIIVAFIISSRLVKRIENADHDKEVMNEKVIETGRLASIGELAAGIAHEINNPVAIMVEEAGWIGDLLEDDDISEDTLNEISRSSLQIQTQGARCKEITHKLLSFARKTDPRVTEIDLNEIILDTISLLNQKTRYANIKVESRLDSDIPPVSASRSELQQVMLNLVNNAVDAVGDGGGVVTLTSSLNGDSVVLEIEDTGHGIPEALLTKIFDPFFTTKPVGQGTGLGLSICFGIINKLGGEIRVRSQVGQGTVFTIHLPKAGARNINNESNREDERHPGEV